MKNDTHIPKVEGVFMAVVKEFNHEYNTDDWYAFIINDQEVDLDVVLIVSKGYSQDKKTAVFRKKLDKLPAKSYAKIELMPKVLFQLNNEFKVSFFVGNTMFEKTFLFRKNTINEKALRPVPLMALNGVLAK